MPLSSQSAHDAWAWPLLQALRERADSPNLRADSRFSVGSDGRLSTTGVAEPVGRVDWRDGQWRTDLTAKSALLDLYLPLCQPVLGEARLLGHLGQSIDGYIATASGDSDYVNDAENITHLHRLRALHDAIVVGAGTIASDNPRLTTRHVGGSNPVRVVLDPRGRLPSSAHVFNDGAAETLLVVDDATELEATVGNARVLRSPARSGRFDLERLVGALASMGLKRLFVEGGGTTVSSFLDAGLLDRLQIAIAPVLIGRGKPGLRLAAQDKMGDCPRPGHRIFAMGRDILIDMDLREENSGPSSVDAAIRRIR